MSLSSLVEPREQAEQEEVGNPGRRTFIKTLGAVGAAAAASAAASVAQGPFVWAQGQTYNWRMATTWPRGLAIFHDGAERFAKIVEERSGGRLRI
jgi:TRAP-type mannitol/chloroaromatic compound transport system substrate-binding protein